MLGIASNHLLQRTERRDGRRPAAVLRRSAMLGGSRRIDQKLETLVLSECSEFAGAGNSYVR
jgi:hypothetical protein